jgi:hypothetical protein
MRRVIPGVVASAAVVSAAVAGEAVPDGWALIADSVAQFSGVQGQGGWHYLFDTGVGTAESPMPTFVQQGQHQIWCAGQSPTFDSFCILMAGWSHANAPGACNTPWSGTQRPIRRWINRTTEALRVHVEIEAATTTAGLLTQLQGDGAIIAEWIWTPGNAIPVDAWIDVPPTTSISIIDDPMSNGCHGDGHVNQTRIYARDCDGNSVPDSVEIRTGAVIDLNVNGIPDSCEIPTCETVDLTDSGLVDGADLGILLGEWGSHEVGVRSDLNRDGTVDGSDLGILLSFWGPCDG